MRFGFVLSWTDPLQSVELARAAEAAGWDGVFSWDGMAFGDIPTYDPWAVMAAVAVATERVRIGAMVFAPTRRRPWEFAKSAVTLDRLSGGRIVLPVGMGQVSDGAFAAVNTERLGGKDRAALLEETLAILRLAETGEPFDFSGEHYTAEGLQLAPSPVQQHIPVWPVASWPHERQLRRAAQWDGVVPVDRSPDRVRGARLRPSVVAAVAERIGELRGGRPFDLITEGETAGPDDTDVIGAYAEAGATWFIESRWGEQETFETLMRRAEAGPPAL